MEFIGYRADHYGICQLEFKINIIVKWLLVLSLNKVQIFLGLIDTYRKFGLNLRVFVSSLNT
jgi:hypothetical protein